MVRAGGGTQQGRGGGRGGVSTHGLIGITAAIDLHGMQ